MLGGDLIYESNHKVSNGNRFSVHSPNIRKKPLVDQLQHQYVSADGEKLKLPLGHVNKMQKLYEHSIIKESSEAEVKTEREIDDLLGSILNPTKRLSIDLEQPFR